MEFKGTKGEWNINYISEIPIGVDAEIEKTELGVYSKNVCEIILPETDEEWEKEAEESIANLKLIAASPELLEACKIAVKAYQELGLEPDQNCYKQALKAINKALGQ